MSVRRLAPADVQPASFAFAPETERFADDGAVLRSLNIAFGEIDW
jgi:hypothetical protein